MGGLIVKFCPEFRLKLSTYVKHFSIKNEKLPDVQISSNINLAFQALEKMLSKRELLLEISKKDHTKNGSEKYMKEI